MGYYSRTKDYLLIHFRDLGLLSFGDAEEEEENELSSSIHKKLHSKGTIGQKKTIKKKKMNVPSEEKIEDNVKPKSKKGAEDFQKAMLDKAKQMQEKFEYMRWVFLR